MTGRRDTSEDGRVFVLILILLSAIVLAGGVVALERREIAERLLLWWLARHDLTPAALVVTRLDTGGLDLADVRIGRAPDLSIGKIETRYSPRNLVRRRQLDLVRVSTLELRGGIDDGTLSFGALDALLLPPSAASSEGRRSVRPGHAGRPASDTPQTIPAIPVIPAARIVVENARVDVTTTAGPAALSLGGELAPTPDAHIQGSFRIAMESPRFVGSANLELSGTATAPRADATVELARTGDRAAPLLALSAVIAHDGGALSVTVPSVPVDLGAGQTGAPVHVSGSTPHLRAIGYHIRTKGGRLRFSKGAGEGTDAPENGVEVEDIRVDVVLDPGSHLPAGTLRIAQIRDLQAPARFLPLAADIEIAPEEGGLLHFAIEVGDARGRVELRASGSCDPRRPSGTATLRLEPLRFGPTGLQPADLLPALGRSVAAARGTIEAGGTFTWEPGKPTAVIDLAVRDLALSSSLGDIEDMNATAHILGPWPLSTPRVQLLSIGRISAGLELTNGLIRYRLRADGLLDIDSAEWTFAGGTITTAARINPGAARNAVTLKVSDVDLSELVALVRLPGLTGDGRLGGVIPVVIHGDTVAIHDGVLATTGPGWIRYRPEAAVGAPAATDQSFAMLLQLLQNFRYERLELRLDGDTRSPVDLTLHLAGANPDYMDGQAVEFNLHVESHLADLVRRGTAAYKLPQVIEERLREFTEKHH